TMNTILFDGPERNTLLPFTYTRPVAEIRVGIMTLREKWEQSLNCKTSTLTEGYLADKWPKDLEAQNLFINPSYLPEEDLIKQIHALNMGEQLTWEDEPIAVLTTHSKPEVKGLNSIQVKERPLHVKHTYDIFSKNAVALSRDFEVLTENKKSAEIPKSVFVVNRENIFVEEGAKLQNCSLNAEDGPIYIGKEAEVMEGALVRGSFALCEHSYLNMGAKVYGATTVGPHSKVGGEINNSIVFGYSNKGHEGFLGNSVLGEWCNIGADSNNSNLKNNYAEVKLWDYQEESFLPTGLQFCGLMMGDHTKCGINTMFNTGTVIGVSANIFGAGFPRNFIPSFSWGGNKMTTYRIDKVFEVAQQVMARRGVELTEQDKAILTHVFELSKAFRTD